MLPSHDRYPYSGIDTRPAYEWPGGRRLAVYIAVNVEHFPLGSGGGIDLDRETKPWSQRSWMWREYGNRVGGWRLAAGRAVRRPRHQRRRDREFGELRAQP